MTDPTSAAWWAELDEIEFVAEQQRRRRRLAETGRMVPLLDDDEGTR